MSNRYLFMTEDNQIVAVERYTVTEAAEAAKALSEKHKAGVFYFAQVGHEPYRGVPAGIELFLVIQAELRDIPTAALFGLIWQKSQRDGVCNASNSELAAELYCHERTIERRISTLVEAGLIVYHRDLPSFNSCLSVSSRAKRLVSGEEAPRPKDIRSGFVYLLQSTENGHIYKIGLSADVARRMKEIGNCRHIHSFAADDMFAAEARLHEFYKSQRLDGEWFYLHEPNVDFICSIHHYQDGEFLNDEIANLLRPLND